MKSCDVTAFEDVGESGANWDTGKLGHREIGTSVLLIILFSVNNRPMFQIIFFW